jgi:hypothetical protein
MRTWIPVAVLALAVALHPAPVTAGDASGKAERRAAEKPAVVASGEWPNTPAGVLARDWVTAFNAGEAAMKQFLSTRLAPGSLEKRPMSARVETYRENRERFGTLTFGSVDKSTPTELSVVLIDADAKPMTWIFKAQPKAPHHLESVSRREHGHGSGFHH